VGERNNDILGRQLHRIVKLCRSGGIIAGVEGLYAGLKVAVGLSFFCRFGRGALF
jgi:hypothetical protein